LFPALYASVANNASTDLKKIGFLYVVRPQIAKFLSQNEAAKTGNLHEEPSQQRTRPNPRAALLHTIPTTLPEKNYHAIR
jgi:hypothetical protein